MRALLSRQELTFNARFDATDAPAGSTEKIEILRKRLELGLPLWHGSDRYDYNGLTGANRHVQADDIRAGKRNPSDKTRKLEGREVRPCRDLGPGAKRQHLEVARNSRRTPRKTPNADSQRPRQQHGLHAVDADPGDAYRLSVGSHAHPG